MIRGSKKLPKIRKSSKKHISKIRKKIKARKWLRRHRTTIIFCSILFVLGIIALCIFLFTQPVTKEYTEEQQTESSAETVTKAPITLYYECMSGVVDVEIPTAVNKDTFTTWANGHIAYLLTQNNCYAKANKNSIFDDEIAANNKTIADLQYSLTLYDSTSYGTSYDEEGELSDDWIVAPEITTHEESQLPYCRDIEEQYSLDISAINRAYNYSVQEASMECAHNGAAFGGCTDIAEEKLRREKDLEIAQKTSQYENDMQNCQ